MMSAEEVRKQIKNVQQSISYRSTTLGEINYSFLRQVNLLQDSYGAFLGKAKAQFPEYIKEINNISDEIKTYFEYMTRSSNADYCFKLANLAIGKISELLLFIEGLRASPPERKISKRAYEQLVKESEANRRALEILVKYKGLPELNELLEKARNVKLPIDEHWVLALCSANLIEAVVNKKLKDLELSTEGSFENRYKRLANGIKEKEKRDIQKLLPLALYKEVRNKLDHASHALRVTPREAKDISKIVIDLISEVFQ